MMKNVKKLYSAGVMAIVLSACSSTATISISAQEQFILGERSEKNFSARISNLSREDVNVVIIDTKSGEQTQGFGLSGKGNAKIYVSREETVILKNPSSRKVRIRAILNKNVEGMRYQPIDTATTK